MKIYFTRKEIAGMFKHITEEDGSCDDGISLEIKYGMLGATNHIVNEDGAEKDITDYSVW